MGGSLQGKEEEEHFTQGEEHVQGKAGKGLQESVQRVVRMRGSQEMRTYSPGKVGWSSL